MSESLNYLVHAITELEPNSYYFTRFKAMDAVCAFGPFDKPIGLINRLEVERARKEGRFEEVLDLNEYMQHAVKKFGKANLACAIALAAEEKNYKTFQVPHDFPAGLYSELIELGLTLQIIDKPFFPQRSIKSAQEVDQCKRAAQISEAGFQRVAEILRQSEINTDATLQYQGRVLTCETLRREIRVATTQAGGGQNSPIAACGPQAADCHCIGFGPVVAHQMIVIDIFPRDDDSYMFGDISRTFVKGKPSSKMQHIYDTVYLAHQAALENLGPGRTLGSVDQAARKVLDERGYPTRQRPDGQWEGCYCGIGHGLGLEVHEFPFIRNTEEPMLPGQVITIEPGLYLPEIGGCRIEDTIVITETGWEFINTPHYDWVIA